MNSILKFTSYIMLGIFGILVLSFLYFGITHKTQVSFDYNVPIAQSILSGKFLTLHKAYYVNSPGASHIILALFVLLGFPNLFGVFGVLYLFIACKKMGDTFGLTTYMAIIFAVAFCLTISVVRTIADESIDKWLCTWFIASVIMLEKPKTTYRWSALLGLFLGLLVGTKYSGPLFFLALVPIYLKTVFRYFHPLRFLLSFTIFTIVGLFWYIRNYLTTGSPYFPSGIFIFKGAPHFAQQDWMLIKIPLLYPQGIGALLNAFFSEYLLWAFAPLVIVGFLVVMYHRKQKIETRLKRVFLLCLTTGIISLTLPVTPPYHIELFHIVSDMRYIYIVVAMMMLGVFLIAQKFKKNTLLSVVTIFSALPVFSFIPYQPKIFILSSVVMYILYDKRIWFLKKI